MSAAWAWMTAKRESDAKILWVALLVAASIIVELATRWTIRHKLALVMIFSPRSHKV